MRSDQKGKTVIVKEIAEVISQTPLTRDIRDLRLRVSFSDQVKAGQFVSLFSSDSSRLLPRPISVCEVIPGERCIRLVYRIAGEGTKEFSRLAEGDNVRILGPQGNGFPLELARGRKILLAGGGIGLPPMLSCAKELALHFREEDSMDSPKVLLAAGYRSSETYLLEEMKAMGPVYVSTDDGTYGVQGTVLDAVREAEKAGDIPDIIFACGPLPMLKALKEYAGSHMIPLYLSMEERMACGVGVCLGCVVNVSKTDDHSHVKKARVCRDGPVFRAEEVDL